MSASASSEASHLVTITSTGPASLGKRRGTGQPSGGVRSSLHCLGSEGRPNSTGLSLDTHEEDSVPFRATQSSQSGLARDNPLRASKDGRPASRPNATLQSPYLQPPGGIRASQNAGHRPNSRQQSQQSPQPQHPQQQPLGGQQHTPASPAPTSAAAAGAASNNPLRRFTNTGTGSASGARIFQAYGAPPPRPFQPVTAGPPHPGAQPSPKPAPPPARMNDALMLQQQQQQQHHHHLHHQQQQLQHQQQQQQQQARAIVAQQQQQQAGPRATTALSGARSMQRGTGSGALGAAADAGTTAAPQQQQQQAAGFRPAPAPGLGPGAYHPGGGGQLGSGPGGLAPYPDGASASFGYDDIPEEDEESISPIASNANALSGLTLDQYMQRMVTTPASAAATSGLGVSADSPESAPCSPGNVSTRTEEEDSPHSSPYAMPYTAATTSPSMGRPQYSDSERGGGGVRRGGGGGLAGALAGGPSGPSPPAPGGSSAMPRLGTGSRAPVGVARNSVASSGSGGLLQRVGSGGISTAAAAAAVTTAAAANGGARISLTNAPAPAPGRGATGMGGPPARGGGGAAATSPMYDDVYGGGGGVGADVSALMDGGSSDDDQLNPSVLLDSPRSSRRLSSRASAMAFSNSLDLRPATAAVVSSSSLGRGDANTPRGIAMAAETANHHAIIKQVDLGGLSASLFTPNNANSGRETSGSPASTANNLAGNSSDLLTLGSNPSSPDLPVGIAISGPAGRGDSRRIAAGVAAGGGSSGGGGTGISILRPTGPSSGDHTHVAAAFHSPGSSGGGANAAAGGGAKALISPKTSMSALPPPWGVSAREGAFGGGQAGDGAGGAGSLQALAARPLSSRGRPGAAAAAAGGGAGAGGDMVSPGTVSAAAAGARPGSAARWAKPQQQQQQQQQVKSDAGAGPPVMDLPPEARLLAAEAQGLPRPPTRQVQSARPPGCRGEVELDPSVWQANIAMQLQQRPPSRQKPPPEALHLWTPEQQMGMLAAGAGLMGRPGGGGRARPQSAAPTTYRGTRPTSGPSVKAHGPLGDDMAGTSARPPSRQKPPPLSTLLEHDDFPPPPPAGSRRLRPGADTMDVVMSCSEDDDDDDDDDDLDL